MINLLIFSDSSVTQQSIRNTIGEHPNIKIVGEPTSEQKTIELAIKLKPDVMVINFETPSMNRLKTLQKILSGASLPIIVISNSSRFDTETIKAISFGAVDFIPIDLHNHKEDLINKILYWGNRNIEHTLQYPKGTNSSIPSFLSHLTSEIGLIVIGTSAGGPVALLTLLKSIKELNCPMVIAQHLPKNFTKLLASYLHVETGLNIVEGQHGLNLYPGLIAIAQGGIDSFIQEDQQGNIILQEKIPSDLYCHPSIDTLFESAAHLSKPVLGIILTGMGTDGKLGARAISNTDNTIIAQSPATCMVDTMPKTVIEDGHATYVLEISEIAQILLKWCAFK